MGGVREGVLEDTGERARECSGVRERKRRVLSDSTRELAAEATSISCSRSQGIGVMHASQSCGSVCHRWHRRLS